MIAGRTITCKTMTEYLRLPQRDRNQATKIIVAGKVMKDRRLPDETGK